LTLTNVIVVTRPGYEIGFSHVTDEIRTRVIDLRKEVSGLRSQVSSEIANFEKHNEKLLREKLETEDVRLETQMYITDAVQIDVSSTDIRKKVREDISNWRELVPEEVAKYVKKYDLYI